MRTIHTTRTVLTTLIVSVLILCVALIIAVRAAHTHITVSAPKIRTSDTTASHTTTPHGYAVLAPATVPSKVPECATTVTFSSNGNPAPITCANGGLNTREWNALAGLEPKIMTLGYDATAQQVTATLCADVHANVSNPIEVSAYRIASLYYGWHFASHPSNVIKNGTCVNVDD